MVHVHVTTRPLDSDAPGKHVVIDHNVQEHRSWLGKHCFWAFRNGHSVTTYPTDEAVNYRPKIAKPIAATNGAELSPCHEEPCPAGTDDFHFPGGNGL